MRTTVVACLLLFGCSQSEPPPQRVVIEFNGVTDAPEVDAKELEFAQSMGPHLALHSKAGADDLDFVDASAEFIEQAEQSKDAAFIIQWTDGVRTPQEFTTKWRAKHPRAD